MVGLDEAHQLEVQIMNLKNLGYTMVRSAIPPLKLQEIQTAFEQKMSEQIATKGRGHRNAFNRFDLIPLWQEPVLSPTGKLAQDYADRARLHGALLGR